MDERIKELAAVCGEKFGISTEEAYAYICETIQAICEAVRVVADVLGNVFNTLRNIGDMLQEAVDAIEVYKARTALQRKEERQRAHRIEREYRAWIRWCEQQRIVRKVWKPP